MPWPSTGHGGRGAGGRRRGPDVRVDSLRRAAGWRAALAAPAAGGAVGRRARRLAVAACLHASHPARAAGGGSVLRSRGHPPGGGLPVSERVVGVRARRCRAGAGLDSRRGAPHGRRIVGGLRRFGAGVPRRRRGDDQLPPGRARLSGPPAVARGVRQRRFRKLRPSRPGCRAGVGAAQHRRLRGRPAAGHHLRRVGRLVERQLSAGDAVGEGAVSPAP